MPRFRHRIAISLLLVLGAALAFAAKQFVMPTPRPASTYPANDNHTDEHVAVAVEPYDTPDKAKIFSAPYVEEGFVPIFVVITNDGDQPISLNNLKAQLVTVDRAKLSPSGTDDIYRRLSHPTADASRSPLPFPKKKVKGGVNSETIAEMRDAQFGAKAVEPHSTQAGFLFFDVSGMSTPLAGANFYLTGVRDAKGNELLYFEIPLEKYLSAPQPAKTQ
jgi:hypothetical protein